MKTTKSKLRRWVHEPAFWAHHFGSCFETFGLAWESPSVERLAEQLFFAETARTIRPAADKESKRIASHVPDVLRLQVLRRLAVAKLPRHRIELRFSGKRAWRIEYGPGGSVAHWLLLPERRELLLLAEFSGHPTLPGIRHPEWIALIDAVVDSDAPAEAVPLLLLPAVGPSSPAQTVRALARNSAPLLRELGVTAAALVKTLPRSRWKLVEPWGWITDHEGSLRNPDGAHSGGTWRRLGREREAAELRAGGWQAGDQYLAVRRFMDAL